MRSYLGLSVAALAAGASGCVNDNAITFAQVEVLGAHTSAGTGTPATAEATLGYRGVNYARVPVPAGPAEGGGGQKDALSVFGQFNANALPGSGATVGKYFATGVAAQKLADKAGGGIGMAQPAAAVSAAKDAGTAEHAASAANAAKPE